MHKRSKRFANLLAMMALAVSVTGCGSSAAVDSSSSDLTESSRSQLSSSSIQESSESSRPMDESVLTSEEVAAVIQDYLEDHAKEQASLETQIASLEAELASLEAEAAAFSEAAASSEAASSSAEEASDLPSKEENIPTKSYTVSKKYGSAGDIKGKTLLMSIFADEADSSWNWEDQEDMALYSKMYYRLETACNWLEKQCRTYGAESEFVWDWMENADLYKRASFTEKLIRSDGGGYKTQKKWIQDNVDVEGTLKKYDADNIIFLFFFDSAPEDAPNPWSISIDCGEMCDLEICDFFVRYREFEVEPNTMAHEFLHCFGAPDLYYSGDRIPQKYVDHLKKTKSKDILYMVYDSEEIKETFSDLDAYYVGLTDSCADVEKWGLGKSSYVK